jgi:hypothetical protein
LIRVLERKSTHLISMMEEQLVEKDEGPTPEENLERYLERRRRGEMDERTVERGDADNDSGGAGHSGDSIDTADRSCEGDEREHREAYGKIGYYGIGSHQIPSRGFLRGGRGLREGLQM